LVRMSLCPACSKHGLGCPLHSPFFVLIAIHACCNWYTARCHWWLSWLFLVPLMSLLIGIVLNGYITTCFPFAFCDCCFDVLLG
jgi:hypothetical protein